MPFVEDFKTLYKFEEYALNVENNHILYHSLNIRW